MFAVFETRNDIFFERFCLAMKFWFIKTRNKFLKRDRALLLNRFNKKKMKNLHMWKFFKQNKKMTRMKDARSQL